MCDYSLHHVASRPARVDDKLVTTRFSNTSTRGFAAVGEPDVAVCLLPGTELAFDKEAEWDHAFGRVLPVLQLDAVGRIVHRLVRIERGDPLRPRLRRERCRHDHAGQRARCQAAPCEAREGGAPIHPGKP